MPPGTSLEFNNKDNFTLTAFKDGKPIKIRLDLRILPIAEAEKRKVGEGRENPNVEPHLPPPVGRITFSLNPFTMLVSSLFLFSNLILPPILISSDLLSPVYLL